MFGQRLEEQTNSNISDEDLAKLKYYFSRCIELEGNEVTDLVFNYQEGILKATGQVNDDRCVKYFVCTGYYNNDCLDLRFLMQYDYGEKYSTNEIIDFRQLRDMVEGSEKVMITSFLANFKNDPLKDQKGITREITPYLLAYEQVRSH